MVCRRDPSGRPNVTTVPVTFVTAVERSAGNPTRTAPAVAGTDHSRHAIAGHGRSRCRVPDVSSQDLSRPARPPRLGSSARRCRPPATASVAAPAGRTHQLIPGLTPIRCEVDPVGPSGD